MNAEELAKILEDHGKWRRGEGGSYANLSGANLRGANLSYANLRGANLSYANLRYANLRYANLSGADLSYANLSGANLRGANLRGADLRGADLRGANLRGADLSDANLSGANLRGADLSDANLSGANLRGADLSDADLSDANLRGANLSYANLSGTAGVERFRTSIVPQVGQFTIFKKARIEDGDYRSEAIITLLVIEDAKRSNAPGGRKIRVSKATVIKIVDCSDAPISETAVVCSGRDATFIYAVGETLTVDNFDEDHCKECAPGLHGFLSFEEAKEYSL